jgi:ketosteroid isomerase-like protein
MEAQSMKTSLLRGLVLGILVSAAILPVACVTSGGALSPAESAAAEDLGRRFTEAMSRKDLDGAMSCFWNSPDLIVVLFGNVQRGYEDVRGGIAAMFEQNETVKLTVNEISYVPVGNMIMAVGTATYDLKPKGGPAIQLVERWTDLEQKIDGRWVYVLDHATMVPK